ncbi:MAG: hypothetical protein ATN33_02855 [Epulopiscium sp. Nele67-Bin001]|nr:MAG: hypothetical protein ATN33_02855 [Epulopiscium sp. Nele67-Bin001]
MINKRLVRTSPHSMKHVRTTVICQWIGLIFNLLALSAFAAVIQAAYVGNLTNLVIIQNALLIAVAILIRMATTLKANKAAYNASKTIKNDLRQMIYDKLINLGISYNQTISTSRVMQVSTEGVEQIEIYFGRYLPQFFYSMLAPLTLFIVIATINLKIALILLICVPLIPISIIAVNKFAKTLFKKYWGAYTNLGDRFLDNLQGLTTLKVYGTDGLYHKQMNNEAEHFRKITMKVLTMQLNSITIMDLVAYGGAALGIIFSLMAFYAGDLSLGQTIFIILVTSEFFIPMRLLGSYFHVAMNGVSAAQSIFEILDTNKTAENIKEGKFKTGPVQLKRVFFSYNDSKDIIKGISFKTATTGLYSIVGKSGCGKSTIASLLMGLQTGFGGEIQIGGVNLESIKDLNKHMCIVKHQSYLFRGTIRQNLKMANKRATDEQMLNALRHVQLLGEIEAKGGLDFVLQENGNNLSGGQRQRLALARALVRDAAIYIFDEATSNIDIESEVVFNNIIKNLAKNRLVILISHRLANVISSDRIFVLSEGMLVEEGTHEQLMENRRIYFDLFTTQAGLEAIYNSSQAIKVEMSAENNKVCVKDNDAENKVAEGMAIFSTSTTGKPGSSISGRGSGVIPTGQGGSSAVGIGVGVGGGSTGASMRSVPNSDASYDDLEKSLIKQGLYNPESKVIKDNEDGQKFDLSKVPQATLFTKSALMGNKDK